VIVIPLVLHIFLLILVHIPEISAQGPGQFLFEPDKQPVLVKPVIDNFPAEMNSCFIGDHQHRHFLIFKHRDRKTQQVPDAVGKPVVPCLFSINDLLLPALFVADPLGNSGFMPPQAVLHLLVNTVFPGENIVLLYRGSQPHMTIPCHHIKISFEIIAESRPYKIKTGFPEKIIPPYMKIPDQCPVPVQAGNGIDACPALVISMNRPGRLGHCRPVQQQETGEGKKDLMK